ncbi:CatB-related O-acetyltransferase [Pseudalkalibacillus hwajinpoensis]|uniref:CatB-related O-acetyltransferase n=1 Tax=Guptibacillus hwajinpoensis TaxID=208199 RepID=UPI00325BC39B
MEFILKALFRIYRILIGKKGVYGKIGIGNKFTKGLFIEEAAHIGNYNYIGPYSMINNGYIGNYCSIGPSVKIGQGKHSLDYITTFQKISSELIGHSLKTSPTKIGNDVWCGANVVIMQGIKIGDGVVIGANAVVTKDIPDYAVAVGIPAKVIKYRFSPETIKTIKNSKWFDKDIEKAKNTIRLLEKEQL